MNEVVHSKHAPKCLAQSKDSINRGSWFSAENLMVCSVLILPSELLSNLLAFSARPAQLPPTVCVPEVGPHSSASAPSLISMRLSINSHAMYFSWSKTYSLGSKDLTS